MVHCTARKDLETIILVLTLHRRRMEDGIMLLGGRHTLSCRDLQ